MKTTKLSIVLILFIGLMSCTNKLSEAQKEQFLAKGKEVAAFTAESMLKEVGKNMQQGGVVQAVPFCNVQASHLTQDISNHYGVTIKRTSLKLRNEKNAPNARELEILNQYQDLVAQKGELKPIVEQNPDGSVQFYAPIKLMQKCTVCHGVVGETMTVQSDSIIKSLYPVDKAIGFKEGDLRGIWSITFPEKP